MVTQLDDATRVGDSEQPKLKPLITVLKLPPLGMGLQMERESKSRALGTYPIQRSRFDNHRLGDYATKPARLRTLLNQGCRRELARLVALKSAKVGRHTPVQSDDMKFVMRLLLTIHTDRSGH